MKTLRLLALSTALAAALPVLGHAATMQCAPLQVMATRYPTGTTYTAAADGIVTNVAANDIEALLQDNCTLVGVAGETLIARLIGANMNVTTDQTIPLLIPATQNYTPTKLWVRNCSVSLTTAAGSVYSAASKGGTTLLGTGAAQAMTGCTGTGLTAQYIVATSGGLAAVLPSTTPPILSLTTAQGAAATADIYVFGVTGN